MLGKYYFLYRKEFNEICGTYMKIIDYAPPFVLKRKKEMYNSG
jgi:hypothetical protein